MKRWFAIWCGILCLLTLTACGNKAETSDPATARKIGLGSVNTVTMDGTDKNRVKVTVAAVVLDKDGKILECELDEVDFTATLQDGMMKPVTSSDLTSKDEKGDSYIPGILDTGMENSTATSWEDQAEAFCDFVEGKMVGEVTGLATTDGKSDNITGCDLIVTDFIQAVERAASMAKAHDIAADDDLHLAIISAPASDSNPESPRFTMELAAVTLDDHDRITGCMTDSLQMKLDITDGVFTTLSGPVESKRQAGDSYGMKEASAIKREWYEQADAFDTYVRGKTAAQLASTKLDGDGKTDAISGCTISVTGQIESVTKAAQD